MTWKNRLKLLTYSPTQLLKQGVIQSITVARDCWTFLGSRLSWFSFQEVLQPLHCLFFPVGLSSYCFSRTQRSWAVHLSSLMLSSGSPRYISPSLQLVNESSLLQASVPILASLLWLPSLASLSAHLSWELSPVNIFPNESKLRSSQFQDLSWIICVESSQGL